jgi:hypothetical protein
MISKMNVTDKVIAGMVAVNGLVAGIRGIVTAIEPLLGPLVSVGQIGIAAATIVWIVFRVKGVRLDNKLKEKELKK